MPILILRSTLIPRSAGGKIVGPRTGVGVPEADALGYVYLSDTKIT